MKVYSIAEHLKSEVPRWSNNYAEAEKAFKLKVKEDLISAGYTGSNTGRIARYPAGDGYAEYMFADAGKDSALIHLPLLDGYESPMAFRSTKKQVLEDIAQAEKWGSFW